MTRWSLKRRSLVAAILVLTIFLPLAALVLEQAFSNSLSQSMEEQLRLQNLGLISEFEVIGGEIQMPEQLFNNSLNIPGSGTYAMISMHKLPLWESNSTLSWTEIPELERPVVGKEQFISTELPQGHFFQFSYTAEFEDSGFMFPVTFHILQDRQLFDQEVGAFRTTLWRWLGLIFVLLIALLVFSLYAALRPISELVSQISETEAGNRDRLSGAFPPELERLKSSLNHLLDSELQQRQRYHNSLGDLAHNLKTPLALLKGNEQVMASAGEPVEQIDNIISRQLKRAVAGAGSGWQQKVALAPLLRQLSQAMNKVYADKHLNIELRLDSEGELAADKTDLMELCGNLLDNACKAAKEQVIIGLHQHGKALHLTIEDDGPGIAADKREQILNRGTRLDSYASGQGFGMTIVMDLITAYHARLDIEDAPSGGNLFRVRFSTVTK
ncbi:ATP-binding protein [Lacimicrobium sp. SS2-24]|uniref:ATP-binding protein n=1 Tax=Lacimicrobium sp. SS2-24 TaxID=2005569 RepID=UPI000B4C11F9|nr:ATP-binding protein [Lacimicrobium sp. SS2-24]